MARKITLACTLVYFASYVMRLNFAVMIAKIYTEMGLEKSDLAVVITGLTIAYGAGQIICGIIGDKVRPSLMLTAGLALAAVANIAMYFVSSVPLMTVVWSINGFAHSMLWPPIVRILSTHLNDSEYGYAIVRVSWGSSAATILLYLICPLLIGEHVGLSWKTVMLICAAVGVAVMIFWTAVSPKLLKEKSAAEITSAEMTSAKETSAGTVSRRKLPNYVFLPIAFIMLAIIFQGNLRDGVTNWTPSFLIETIGLPEELAILATVFLAVLSIVSFWAFEIIHRKLFKNEVVCAAFIFGLAAVFAAVLYAVNRLFSSALLSLIFISLVVACMHGVNLMLISIVPKRFAKSGRVSTYSGILNACTYIGAAISTYVFAVLAERYGWDFTLLTWIVLAVAGLVCCFAAVPLWKRFRKEYSDPQEIRADKIPETVLEDSPEE